MLAQRFVSTGWDQLTSSMFSASSALKSLGTGPVDMLSMGSILARFGGGWVVKYCDVDFSCGRERERKLAMVDLTWGKQNLSWWDGWRGTDDIACPCARQPALYRRTVSLYSVLCTWMVLYCNLGTLPS